MPRLSDEKPSESGADGRDRRGRFAAGNRASKGNVLARKAARFRSRLFNTVSEDDFAEVVERLIREAKSGESWACKLLFSYLLGEPSALDALEQIELLRQRIKDLQPQGEQQ